MERVFGKAGRAETATDPAPFSMVETVVVLKPHTDGPRVALVFELGAGAAADSSARLAGPYEYARTDLRSRRDERSLADARFRERLDDADQSPHRHADNRRSNPLGIKILGSDLGRSRRSGSTSKWRLRVFRARRSVFAERTTGGYFLDFDLKRDELARYGLTDGRRQNVLMAAIGGEKSPPRWRAASATR